MSASDDGQEKKIDTAKRRSMERSLAPGATISDPARPRNPPQSAAGSAPRAQAREVREQSFLGAHEARDLSVELEAVEDGRAEEPPVPDGRAGLHDSRV